MIEFSPVSCSRKTMYEAEVQLKWGEFDNPQYKQVFVSTGHASSKEAREAAKVVCEELQQQIVAYTITLMSRYRDAQP